MFNWRSTEVRGESQSKLLSFWKDICWKVCHKMACTDCSSASCSKIPSELNMLHCCKLCSSASFMCMAKLHNCQEVNLNSSFISHCFFKILIDKSVCNPVIFSWFLYLSVFWKTFLCLTLIAVCVLMSLYVCVQIVDMMKAYVAQSCHHDDDVMTELSSLSEQLELTVTVEQIDTISNLLSDFAQLQIDRIHHTPRWTTQLTAYCSQIEIYIRKWCGESCVYLKVC